MLPWCRFYFDFSPTYVGCGLICPHIVNCSVLLGAIISWGFLWPFISQHAGDWYPADLGSNDFKGLYGYKVWWIFFVLRVCTTLMPIYLTHHYRRILWLASWGVPQGRTLFKISLRGGPHLSLCALVHEVPWVVLYFAMTVQGFLYDYKWFCILQLLEFKFNPTGIDFISFSGILYAWDGFKIFTDMCFSKRRRDL